MSERKRRSFQVPGFARAQMAQVRRRAIDCADAVTLLDSLDRIHARAPNVTAPDQCAAAPTLQAIPLLMRPGRFRSDRARLLHAYLRGVREDARQIVAHRAESMARSGNWREWVAEKMLMARVQFWFTALHGCGWLYSARVPMNDSFTSACRALAAALSNASPHH
jgi:hypothetical protein